MVSIVSAIYKSEYYLPGFLMHVKKFADFLDSKNFTFEIVIVPTKPSEKEKKLLMRVKQEPWCKIYECKELGLYRAWNFGVNKAQGNLLGFWNVDDIRFPEAVIEAQELADKGFDVVYFTFILKRYFAVGPLGIPVATRKIQGEALIFEKRKFETTMTAGPHFMFTKKAFEKVGPFDEQFKIAGDFDWIARAASANLKFVCGKEYSGIFRVDGRGLSAGANPRLVAENNLIYKRQKASEKIKTTDPDLEKSYHADYISFGDTKIPFAN